MLTAGIFAGQTLHHALPVGERWADRVESCLGTEPAVPNLTYARAAQRCAEGVNRILVIFEISGVVVAIAGCLGLAVAAQRRGCGRGGCGPATTGSSNESGACPLKRSASPAFRICGRRQPARRVLFRPARAIRRGAPPGLAVRSRITALFDR